jgi:hypothetical protein
MTSRLFFFAIVVLVIALVGWAVASEPVIGVEQAFYAQLMPLQVIPLYLISLFLFIAPGLLVAVRLLEGGYCEKPLVVIMAITTSAVLGYLTFWLYFAGPVSGLIASVSVILVTLGAYARLVRRGGSVVWRSLDLRLPILAMTLIGLFDVSLTYGFDLPTGPEGEVQARMRYMEWLLPCDNLLPMFLAQHLEEGTSPRHLPGGWQSSDRPPLQAGLFLLQRPLSRYLPFATTLHYSVAGAAFQSSWVAALWGLLRSALMPRRRVLSVLGILSFTGFTLINTSYAWPKMLAGALTILPVTLVLSGTRPAMMAVSPSARMVLIATAAAIALLAHGGSAFTLLPLGLLLFWPRYWPGIWRLLMAATIVAIFLLPWLAYQRYYDPPGDRLLRSHLANAAPDSRSVLQAIGDAYRWNASTIAWHKWQNARVLFLERMDVLFGAPSIPSAPFRIFDFAAWRRREFHNLFPALAFLNVGWLVVLAQGLGFRSQDSGLAFATRRLLPFCLVSLMFWILVMFGPGTTIIHHGPYGTFLLFFAALAICLTALLPWLYHCLLGAQLSWFLLVWIITSPVNGHARPHVFMLALAAVWLVFLFRMAWGRGLPLSGSSSLGTNRAAAIEMAPYQSP